MKIIFADPIGHVLGIHDQEICNELVKHDYEVLLATNEDYPFLATGSPFAVIPLFRGFIRQRQTLIKAICYLCSLLRLSKAIFSNKVKVLVFYYTIEPLIDAAFLFFLQKRGIRVILAVHDVLPLSSKTLPWSLKLLYYSCQDFLVFSKFGKSELISQCPKAINSTCIVPFGIDGDFITKCPDQTSARKNLCISSKAPVVLCFGQIKHNKGLEYLLNAIPEVLISFPDALFFIVGRPQKVSMTPFYNTVQQLKIVDNVIFRNEYIPEEDVCNYLSCADIVVLPYTHIYQSAVLPLACALSKPVIATSVGSMPEILEDKISGYLISPQNSDAISKACCELLTNPDNAKKIGAYAQQKMGKYYTWTTFGQNLSNFIERKNN